jgi:hypothetical protein
MMKTNVTEIASYFNADTGLRADIFTVGNSKRVRLVDTDCGEVLPTIKFFMSLEQAHAYARKCVS